MGLYLLVVFPLVGASNVRSVVHPRSPPRILYQPHQDQQHRPIHDRLVQQYIIR